MPSPFAGFCSISDALTSDLAAFFAFLSFSAFSFSAFSATALYSKASFAFLACSCFYLCSSFLCCLACSIMSCFAFRIRSFNCFSSSSSCRFASRNFFLSFLLIDYSANSPLRPTIPLECFTSSVVFLTYETSSSCVSTSTGSSSC